MRNLIFQRYIGLSIIQSSTFVMFGFLSMFFFFDFLAELDDLGTAGYRLPHAVAYVLLGLPNRVVELAPIAALIGSLWALSQSASSSEFTVFRVSGLLPSTALITIFRIGLPMVLVTAIFSELVMPVSEDFRARFRDGSIGSSSAMRSGLWIRDTPEGLSQQAKSTRFVNARRYLAQQTLEQVTVYDFDTRQRLVRRLEAPIAQFQSRSAVGYEWQLHDVTQLNFAEDGTVTRTMIDRMTLLSRVSPEMLGALVTNPDRMSSMDLYRYVQYLKQNKQQSERYEIALWKRVIYPFVIWVMMLLALPAAFLQARAGAVGARVFAGILVGVGFHLLNSLFSHLGVLNTWPAPIMALLPSMMALVVAGFFFYRVQYH